ncbi:MAG: biopolymer transporter ExbD [Gammaproteobacteria bacterium]|nr:biopolymer transporter ExbD [Gammaproteobacteria bacterium]MCP4090093.1 biopolymer transporter ExbD [Gammaproteobacteria bacterium]MCP4277017.1 biopolymer transporter ExbD [Gammaproteobacteria bacterium]MCP4832760.1 biopolymer transporter ExbD [Gammaproteobacteria bacterium]MCP4929953.1 biopolymer transporter ExbD [Gammaproteobacteria bacterium]
MAKHHKRHAIGSLNLISLMDIFTILVFFLLVNSQEVEVLPNAKDMQLPESYAEQKARENVVILVMDDAILVQGKVVASMDEVMSQQGVVIANLEKELRLQTERLYRKDTQANIEDREVTIMGDRELPYSLLKKVMASCTAADYGKISLAVLQKSVGPEEFIAMTQ